MILPVGSWGCRLCCCWEDWDGILAAFESPQRIGGGGQSIERGGECHISWDGSFFFPLSTFPLPVIFHSNLTCSPRLPADTILSNFLLKYHLYQIVYLSLKSSWILVEIIFVATTARRLRVTPRQSTVAAAPTWLPCLVTDVATESLRVVT